MISPPAPEVNPLARRAVRGLKVLVWSALASVLAVALGLLLYFTPIMSARNIVVAGLEAVPEEEVPPPRPSSRAHRCCRSTPTRSPNASRRSGGSPVRGCSESIRRRCGSPWSSGCRWWSRTIRTVRTCSTGTVDFATAPPPPNLPYLETATPGPSDPATKAALQVMLALPPEVAGQVGRIAAPSVASITLTLIDGRVVVWGTTDRTDEKALKLAALLTQPGRTYDVSSPDLPTVK